MREWGLKIVPDSEPNHDGKWIRVSSDYEPVCGYSAILYHSDYPFWHIVQVVGIAPEPEPPCRIGNQAGYMP